MAPAVAPSSSSSSSSGGAVQEWFRSQRMEYLSIVMQEELAHACMTELGALGKFQVVDLLPHKTAFQRRYINEVSRIDQVERKVRYIEDMLDKHEIQCLPAPSTEELLLHLKKRQEEGQTPNALLLDFEALLGDKERELKIVASLQSNLTADVNKSVELKHVLQSLTKLARDDPNIPHGAVSVSDHGGAEGEQADPLQAIRFRFLAGTVGEEERGNFERMIFRTTRGNAYLRFDPIAELLVDPATQQKTCSKSVFVVFFQAKAMEDKIAQVCRAFGAQTFALPGIDSAVEIVQQYEQTCQELQERQQITRRNTEDLYRLLGELARHVLAWKLTLRKEKAVYDALNSMDSSVGGVLRCEGWVTFEHRDQVGELVAQVHRRHHIALPNWVTTVREQDRPAKAPTYYKTNKFTAAFQVIIDTYGVAKYQEVNPALFSTVTFPFCFGVMFGDVGHGFALLLFALALMWKEKELGRMELNEAAALLYNGRYVLALMSVFSIYCGLIYNDAMSLGLALFQPTWSEQNSTSESSSMTLYVRDAKEPQVYPFGADPTWKLANSEIAFYNSFKMKFAVIFGVVHMLAGLVLKGVNAIHYHRGKQGVNLDLWFECVPQILFMCLLFGYMDFLILYKWSIPWGDSCDRGQDYCQPPSIITTMINLALAPGSVKDPMFAGQGQLQGFLVLAAMCCIPAMLCVKPYVLIQRIKHQHGHQHVGLGDEDEHGHHHRESDAHSDGGRSTSDLLGGHNTAVATGGGGDAAEAAHGEEEHSVGDIVIHQAIETIEFILGSISNTASYLRLWALSLAHSQLAAVFWERTLVPFLVGGTSAKQIVGTYIGCAVFFAITFVVLLCMDNLECFLHTLRLHWVEFMNKFFKAEGLKFEPLSFEEIFDEAKKQKAAGGAGGGN